MDPLDTIIQHIEQTTGKSCQPYQKRSIGGGCINTAYQLQTPAGNYFVKLNRPQLADMFEAEADGLNEMTAQNAIRVPEVICYGVTDSHSFLALEYIELSSLRGRATAQLGEQLAQLHQIKQSYFGWHRDNTIGSTPQINTRHADWISFYQQERLAKQYQFAQQNGFGGRLAQQGEKLIDVVPVFFESYQPHPSLLHGDLWGGNVSADENGQPVIYDPACYYGDAEADLAMTELFGGYGADFYAAYRQIKPIDAGYQSRKTLYNLYHILNHLNLFGGGYLGQAESMTQQLLAETRG